MGLRSCMKVVHLDSHIPWRGGDVGMPQPPCLLAMSAGVAAVARFALNMGYNFDGLWSRHPPSPRGLFLCRGKGELRPVVSPLASLQQAREGAQGAGRVCLPQLSALSRRAGVEDCDANTGRRAYGSARGPLRGHG